MSHTCGFVYQAHVCTRDEIVYVDKISKQDSTDHRSAIQQKLRRTNVCHISSMLSITSSNPLISHMAVLLISFIVRCRPPGRTSDRCVTERFTCADIIYNRRLPNSRGLWKLYPCPSKYLSLPSAGCATHCLHVVHVGCHHVGCRRPPKEALIWSAMMVAYGTDISMRSISFDRQRDQLANEEKRFRRSHGEDARDQLLHRYSEKRGVRWKGQWLKISSIQLDSAAVPHIDFCSYVCMWHWSLRGKTLNRNRTNEWMCKTSDACFVRDGFDSKRAITGGGGNTPQEALLYWRDDRHSANGS